MKVHPQRCQDEMRDKVGDAWEGTPEDDRIFTNEVGRPMFPTSITQWMGKFIKRTGLPRSASTRSGTQISNLGQRIFIRHF